MRKSNFSMTEFHFHPPDLNQNTSPALNSLPILAFEVAKTISSV
jgi:hypothetical protein